MRVLNSGLSPSPKSARDLMEVTNAAENKGSVKEGVVALGHGEFFAGHTVESGYSAWFRNSFSSTVGSHALVVLYTSKIFEIHVSNDEVDIGCNGSLSLSADSAA